MRVTVITPPEPFITVDEAKARVRVLTDEEDALIEDMIATATAHVDGPDGWLGRALGRQTLEARGDFFRDRRWYLPYPPVVEIVSLTYLDPLGAVQTLDPTAYELRGHLVERAFATRWPHVRRDDECVRVRYTAGYDAVPRPICAAILLMVGDLYANRETTIGSANSVEVPMSTTVENLLMPFRVWA